MLAVESVTESVAFDARNTDHYLADYRIHKRLDTVRMYKRVLFLADQKPSAANYRSRCDNSSFDSPPLPFVEAQGEKNKKSKGSR